MVITDIKFRRFFSEGPMRAVVSVTFDHQLAVHDIKVIHARERNFIVMPSRKNYDGTYRDIVHPINAQFRSDLESTILAAYMEESARAAVFGEIGSFEPGEGTKAFEPTEEGDPDPLF